GTVGADALVPERPGDEAHRDLAGIGDGAGDRVPVDVREGGGPGGPAVERDTERRRSLAVDEQVELGAVVDDAVAVDADVVEVVELDVDVALAVERAAGDHGPGERRLE